ncbi:guanine nucleotide exchange factor SEC2 NDAI_0F04230 [Naumovozyma dairenensis CBS 421]|uniref:GDP/GTP exchange factor Sec2 N-terminal domain-containing protein n=1 Tax=Naumovozyma dairenensis (strain ATCC 10597 / BCRC 20456 / CBS 421 / NBRC 0211 / NRRL Y-12639) TaxID=1071378 RepID=G0WD80_NAUDC|nr:hypothetical protein NDAI_0F04230 [Naumovozyma dairenensis CBS 421]CCD25741.1 hypothetical protein NDAI_0F04230 [Naumovozyma dairenensis CBS 421]
MPETSEESKRISIQVSSLSTQLIESIGKQSDLEEKLNQANRTITSQKKSLEQSHMLEKKSIELEQSLTARTEEVNKLRERLTREIKLRESAEIEVEKLSKEVEDLTATLFDEANNMVADARKEAHAKEILNSRLMGQLREKDNLLETLTLQLKSLKKVLQNVETENNRYSMILPDSATISGASLDKVTTRTSSSFSQQPMNNGIIYSPNISSIRYDLSLYEEFLKFIAVIPHCKSIKDTSSDSKLIRRLITDEISPVLKIDNANGLGWLVKKTLLSTMMEGLVIVEPLSGINEMYQMGHTTPPLGMNTQEEADAQRKVPKMFKFPSSSPPVAVRDPCAFCGEERNDIIEHARMYLLKTQTTQDDGTLIIANTYPLCHWCLFKIRQTCEIFAFLRSLKTDIWNLEKVPLSAISKYGSSKFSEVTTTNTNGSKKNIAATPKSENKKSKRMSFMAGLGRTHSSKITAARVEPHGNHNNNNTNSPIENIGQPTTNIQRAWLQLCKLRSILHWAHIGIWSVDDSVSTKVGPEVFTQDEEFTTIDMTAEYIAQDMPLATRNLGDENTDAELAADVEATGNTTLQNKEEQNEDKEATSTSGSVSDSSADSKFGTPKESLESETSEEELQDESNDEGTNSVDIIESYDNHSKEGNVEDVTEKQSQNTNSELPSVSNKTQNAEVLAYAEAPSAETDISNVREDSIKIKET